MPSWNAETAECLVYTYKEGLLSRVAHDLKIRVTRFTLSVDDGTVEAVFDADSLRTVVAMRRGREHPSALSISDKQTIDERIRDVVLHSHLHPKIQFHAEGVRETGPSWSIPGTLSLNGARRSLQAVVRTEGDLWITRVQIDQRDYGIEPFRAMLGAVKIKPLVEVVVRCTLTP